MSPGSALLYFASEVLAFAPPTPGTEQHEGKAVCFEVGEGRQANEKLIFF